jgi:uncharacterized protein (DUF952 family)
MVSVIYHITTRREWEQTRTDYRAPSLDSEGFIHCSTAEQVVKVAKAFFHSQRDLVLLCIEPARLASELRWEAPAHPDSAPMTESQEQFPHIYGPINRDAIVRALDFPPDADGHFCFTDDG